MRSLSTSNNGALNFMSINKPPVFLACESKQDSNGMEKKNEEDKGTCSKFNQSENLDI
jgi:hypothetical protein